MASITRIVIKSSRAAYCANVSILCQMSEGVVHIRFEAFAPMLEEPTILVFEAAALHSLRVMDKSTMQLLLY